MFQASMLLCNVNLGKCLAAGAIVVLASKADVGVGTTVNTIFLRVIHPKTPF